MKWLVKAGIQSALACIPGGEAINHELQIYNNFYSRLGWEAQNNASHLARMAAATARFGLKLQGAQVLEVGTGWVPTLPVGLHLLGAEVHSFDHERHLRQSNLRRLLDIYPRLLPTLAANGQAAFLNSRLAALRAGEEESVVNWLNKSGIHYHAPADAARTSLPSSTLDLFFSVAVLEHVSEQVIRAILQEALRTLKPDGLSYHHIGLHDHYADFDPHITYVNFLKYGDFAWKILGQNRIQFHNRLRCSDFLNIFRESGFEVLEYSSKVDNASLQALSRMRLNKRFRGYETSDLATYTMTICCRKAN